MENYERERRLKLLYAVSDSIIRKQQHLLLFIGLTSNLVRCNNLVAHYDMGAHCSGSILLIKPLLLVLRKIMVIIYYPIATIESLCIIRLNSTQKASWIYLVGFSSNSKILVVLLLAKNETVSSNPYRQNTFRTYIDVVHQPNQDLQIEP